MLGLIFYLTVIGLISIGIMFLSGKTFSIKKKVVSSKSGESNPGSENKSYKTYIKEAAAAFGLAFYGRFGYFDTIADGFTGDQYICNKG